MALKLEQLRNLKQVLKATSAPLAFEGFGDFAAAVLHPLIRLLRAQGGNLYITDARLRRKPFFLWHSYDPALVEEYRSQYFRQSPVRIMLARGMNVGQTSEYVDYAEFTKTAFYNEFLAPRRIHSMAALVARSADGDGSSSAVGILGVHRPPDREVFSREDLEILDLLHDPLEGALYTLLAAGNEIPRLERVFRDLPLGVMVLDATLQPLYCNQRLRELLGERLLSARETERLRALARRIRDAYVLPGDDEPTPSVHRFTVTRPAGDIVARITVLPDGLLGTRPHLLCLFEPERSPLFLSEARHLRRVFGLTERESEVAQQCLMGKTNQEIAATLLISPQTVKDHLKKVFEKMGIRRRSQLATLLPPRSLPRA